jgi:hypothetical protein
LRLARADSIDQPRERGSMVDRAAVGGANEVAFEAFGVRLGVSASTPQLLDEIRPFLPPGWKPCRPGGVEKRFSLVADQEGKVALVQDGRPPQAGDAMPVHIALDMFDGELRRYLGRMSRETIFVHAGAVAHAGTTIIMPAQSFGGKTTLVSALVRAGAIYYSDEFAVIDREGLIHPYPKRLSVRDHELVQTEHHVESIGGVAGDGPLPLGMIVVTTYRAGAAWHPEALSAGAGALALLSNALPAQERPQEVMEAVTRAASDAIVIASERGEADEVAPLLLAELERKAG